MAKVVQIEPGFEREILSCEEQPDDSGYEVKFRCGHVVWFAIEVRVGDRSHCSICFSQFLELLRARKAGA